MTVIIVTPRDVERFAAASGDRNPLHLDPDYCRTTSYGRPIVHGALAVLATAAQLDVPGLDRKNGLRVVFRQPVFASAGYEAKSTAEAVGRTVTLQLGDLCLLSLTPGSFLQQSDHDEVDAGHVRPALTIDFDAARPPESARAMSDDDLLALGMEEGEYRPDWRELWGLASRFKFAHGDPWLGCLAWLSFWTGMRTPGRDALLCGVRMQRDSSSSLQPGSKPDRISYRVQSPRYDRRTGVVELAAHLAMPDASFWVGIESVLRRSAPQALPSTMAPQLRNGKRLAGETIAVIGGSRGLGRALSLALAQLGATVLVVHRESSDRVIDMQAQLSSRRDLLVAVKCDAGDPGALEAALAPHQKRLRGLILCAAPAIESLPLSAAATDQMLRYVDTSVRLVWSPLTICTPRLLDEAFVVFASSAAVDDPPRWWPHYVAAKSAVEGIARFTAAQKPWKVTIARVPRLWTELNGSLTGALGTTPTETVAARLLQSILDDGAGCDDAADTGVARLLKGEQLT